MSTLSRLKFKMPFSCEICFGSDLLHSETPEQREHATMLNLFFTFFSIGKWQNCTSPPTSVRSGTEEILISGLGRRLAKSTSILVNENSCAVKMRDDRDAGQRAITERKRCVYRFNWLNVDVFWLGSQTDGDGLLHQQLTYQEVTVSTKKASETIHLYSSLNQL